jgi:hypothetical protein
VHNYCIATDALKLQPVRAGHKFFQCDVTNKMSTTTRLVVCRVIFVIGTVGMLWTDRASDCSYTEVQQWRWRNTHQYWQLRCGLCVDSTESFLGGTGAGKG